MRLVVSPLGAGRVALGPLGGASALSWRVALAFVPMALASQVFADATILGGPTAAWLVVGGVGVGAFLAVYGVARRLLRVTDEAAAPGSAAVLATYVAAGLARTATVALLAVLLGLADGFEPAYRLAGALVFTPVLCGVVARAVGRHDAHRELVSELEAKRTHLVQLRRSADASLARTEAALLSSVRASIEPIVGALDALLASLPSAGSTQPAIDALGRLVEEEVRPLSHRLAGEVGWNPSEAATLDRPSAGRVPLPRRALIADAFRPGLASLIFIAVALPTALRSAPVAEVVPYVLVAFAVTWLVLCGVRWALRSAEASVPIAVVAVAGLYVAIAAVLAALLPGPWLAIAPLTRWAALLISATAGVAVLAASLVDARRSATESELADAVAELERVVGVVRRRDRVARLQLAQLLHGRLQGALYAAMIRLAEARRPEPAVVDAIRADIAAALAQMAAPAGASGGRPLQATLDELVGTWGEWCSFDVTLDPAAVAALAADREAEAALADVVQEAVNNALRHGRARRLGIEVTLTPAASTDWCPVGIALTVSDDGHGEAAAGAVGFGTAIYNELCASWGREQTADGSRFSAVIALH
jgi:signal transduction histidine kinase